MCYPLLPSPGGEKLWKWHKMRDQMWHDVTPAFNKWETVASWPSWYSESLEWKSEHFNRIHLFHYFAIIISVYDHFGNRIRNVAMIILLMLSCKRSLLFSSGYDQCLKNDIPELSQSRAATKSGVRPSVARTFKLHLRPISDVWGKFWVKIYANMSNIWLHHGTRSSQRSDWKGL